MLNLLCVLGGLLSFGLAHFFPDAAPTLTTLGTVLIPAGLPSLGTLATRLKAKALLLPLLPLLLVGSGCATNADKRAEVWRVVVACAKSNAVSPAARAAALACMTPAAAPAADGAACAAAISPAVAAAAAELECVSAALAKVAP